MRITAKAFAYIGRFSLICSRLGKRAFGGPYVHDQVRAFERLR